MSTELVVLLLVFVVCSIDFDHQTGLPTIEVSDKERFSAPRREKERVLAKKLLAEKLAIPEALPESRFRGGRPLPKFSC